MYKTTEMLKEHVGNKLKEWNWTQDPIDEAYVANVIKESMAEKDGFEYIRNQRPDEEVYRKLLELDGGEQCQQYIETLRSLRPTYQTAENDIQRLKNGLDARKAGKSEEFSFIYNKQGVSAMRKRQKDLSLCLSISPMLTCNEVDTVLWKFLGQSPLHMRNPIDVIYAFVLKARDAKASGFETLEAQQECVRELMTFADKDCCWGFGRKENEGEELPGTQWVKAELDELTVGCKEEFKEWFEQNIRFMDIKDHRYSVREYFMGNLMKIALAREAAGNAVRVGGRYERWFQERTAEDRFDGEFSVSEVSRLFYETGNKLRTGTGIRRRPTSRELDEIMEYAINGGEKPDFSKTQQELEEKKRLDKLIEQIFSSELLDSDSIEKQNALKEEIDDSLPKGNREAELRDAVQKGVAALQGIEIATWSIGLQFYACWHEIGVQFTSDYRNGLPENFPQREIWQEYVDCLNQKGDTTYMEQEPDYLQALRIYCKKFPQENEWLKDSIERVEKAQEQFEFLMESNSIFQYIMSEWHYDCITDKNKGKDYIGRDAADENSERLQRLISHQSWIARPDRTEVVDVPKSLLILSEIAAQNVKNGGWVEGSGLLEVIDERLQEYGYPQMDIRKRLDHMIYWAVKIAEESRNNQKIRFDEIFDGLYKAIEEYVFGDYFYKLEEINQRDEERMDAASVMDKCRRDREAERAEADIEKM